MKDFTLSVVIPTYNRGTVLLDTIDLLCSQSYTPEAIYIVDQSKYENGDPVSVRLQSLHDSEMISWVQLDKPSIPVAMNTGLQKASTDYVLFLDDDVLFESDFLKVHYDSIVQHQPIAHVGQIVQPWQSVITRVDYQAGKGIEGDLNFPFNSNQPAEIVNCMAGNLCVNRLKALQVAGFDERFEGVAYRFETEFCRRLITYHKEKFRFEPRATLKHLKVNTGGTRYHAKSHLSSLSAAHSVGDYYFAMSEMKQTGQVPQSLSYICRRFFGSVIGRFYLRKPWYMPVRIVSEFMGICKAIKFRIAGAKTIK